MPSPRIANYSLHFTEEKISLLHYNPLHCTVMSYTAKLKMHCIATLHCTGQHITDVYVTALHCIYLEAIILLSDVNAPVVFYLMPSFLSCPEELTRSESHLAWTTSTGFNSLYYASLHITAYHCTSLHIPTHGCTSLHPTLTLLHYAEQHSALLY